MSDENIPHFVITGFVIIVLACCVGWYYSTACELDLAKAAIAAGLHQVQSVGTAGYIWVK